MIHTDHPERISADRAISLIILIEGAWVDQDLTQARIFPILKPEDWDRRAGCHQYMRQIIDISPNACHWHFVDENFDQIAKSFAPCFIQGLIESHIALQDILPTLRKRFRNNLDSSQRSTAKEMINPPGQRQGQDGTRPFQCQQDDDDERQCRKN